MHFHLFNASSFRSQLKHCLQEPPLLSSCCLPTLAAVSCCGGCPGAVTAVLPHQIVSLCTLPRPARRRDMERAAGMEEKCN